MSFLHFYSTILLLKWIWMFKWKYHDLNLINQRKFKIKDLFCGTITATIDVRLLVECIHISSPLESNWKLYITKSPEPNKLKKKAEKSWKLKKVVKCCKMLSWHYCYSKTELVLLLWLHQISLKRKSILSFYPKTVLTQRNLRP